MANETSYDVFLCYNSLDRPEVKQIALRLREEGLVPWLDEWELMPGRPWQRELEKQIDTISSAAVFVGQEGVGPWQNMEIDAYLRAFVERDCSVIPVVLPACSTAPKLPTFLKTMQWVDFRRSDPDPLQQLIWGITGKR